MSNPTTLSLLPPSARITTLTISQVLAVLLRSLTAHPYDHHCLKAHKEISQYAQRRAQARLRNIKQRKQDEEEVCALIDNHKKEFSSGFNLCIIIFEYYPCAHLYTHLRTHALTYTQLFTNAYPKITHVNTFQTSLTPYDSNRN